MKYLKYLQTANDFEQFKNSEDYILPNVSYIVASDTVMYGISKTEEGEYKVFLLSKKNISGLTYNAVDLGLPSGRLWADRNVGASSSEDYGTYFAWGETEGFTYEGVKNITAEKLCAYMQPLIGTETTLTPDNIDVVLSELGVSNKDLTSIGVGLISDKAFSDDWSDYFDTTDGGSTFNKYDTNKLTTLEVSDDAATVNMGSNWRMPTQVEFQELINNCTATFIDLHGNEFSKSEAQSDSIPDCNLKGIKFTGSNGNSIFMPASGYCYYALNGAGCYCYLWSSDLSSSNVVCATSLYFHSDLTVVGVYRYCGMAVRAIR